MLKKMRYLFPSLSFIMVACSLNNEPMRVYKGNVMSQHSDQSNLITYQIPRGKFRGILWPTPDNPNFRIWVTNHEEHYYPIPAPHGFVFEKTVTEDWEIKIIGQQEKEILYSLERKNKPCSMQIKLPIKKRGYDFYVLKGNGGNEVIVFGDIAGEPVFDWNGLFGYLPVRSSVEK
jgi:hypothetical protein